MADSNKIALPGSERAPVTGATQLGPADRAELLELIDPDDSLRKDSPNFQLSAHGRNAPPERADVHVGPMFQLGDRRLIYL